MHISPKTNQFCAMNLCMPKHVCNEILHANSHVINERKKKSKIPY